MHAKFFKEITGREGSVVIADTNEHLPTPGTSFFCLVCITATQIAEATMSNVRNIGTTTFAAGALIYGHFDRVTLTSGSVQAFETDK